jgi:hypothetical protein
LCEESRNVRLHDDNQIARLSKMDTNIAVVQQQCALVIVELLDIVSGTTGTPIDEAQSAKLRQ